jgi:hypothetical protein
MIKNNDLRIGNLIKHGDIIFAVSSIGENSVHVKRQGDNKNSVELSYENIEGLPITKELLNQFKWKQNIPNSNYYLFEGSLASANSRKIGFLDIEFPYNNDEYTKVWIHQDKTKNYLAGTATLIASFHELQNLIYGLTKLELTELI